MASLWKVRHTINNTANRITVCMLLTNLWFWKAKTCSKPSKNWLRKKLHTFHFTGENKFITFRYFTVAYAQLTTMDKTHQSLLDVYRGALVFSCNIINGIKKNQQLAEYNYSTQFNLSNVYDTSSLTSLKKPEILEAHLVIPGFSVPVPTRPDIESRVDGYCTVTSSRSRQWVLSKLTH